MIRGNTAAISLLRRANVQVSMQPPKKIIRSMPVQLKLLNQHPIDNATSVVTIELLAALT